MRDARQTCAAQQRRHGAIARGVMVASGVARVSNKRGMTAAMANSVNQIACK